MLLNEQEVAQFPLNKRAVEDYTAQSINVLNGIANPAERYAVARCIKNIVDKVVEEVGASAEAYYEKENVGSDGKEFELLPLTKNPAHKDVWLIRQFDCDYNYAGNATDEEGAPVLYTEHKQAVEKAELAVRAKRAILKADKILIENAHPNMKPEVIKVVVKLTSIPD